MTRAISSVPKIDDEGGKHRWLTPSSRIKLSIQTKKSRTIDVNNKCKVGMYYAYNK